MGSRLNPELVAAPDGLLEWRVVAASVAGTSHVEGSLPCQDAHATAVTDEGLLVVAVADGAGSAPRGQDGARAAVEAAVASVRGAAGAPGRDGVRNGILAARDAVLAAAGDDDPRLLATTLALLVADHGVVVAAQVGDGCIVVRTGADLHLVGPVERSEFLNETCFVTSSGWEDDLRVDVVERDGTDASVLDAVAVMTDGLQLLALDLAAGSPHPGFFGPLFDWASGEGADDDELARFLCSERVCARTDDDKTLVLATLGPAAGTGPR